MNTDDFLREAISAARDQADDGVADGAATRLRIRESLDKRGQARRKHLTVIAALIASLFGSTAFAYWAGWRPPWSKPDADPAAGDDESVERVSMRLPDGARAKTRGHTETPLDIAAPAPVTPPAPTPPPPAPPSVPAPSPRASQPTRTSTTSSPSTTPRMNAVTTIAQGEPSTSRPNAAEPSAPPAIATPTMPPATAPAVALDEAHPDPELAAYGRAHNLHFRGGDPAAALAAWNAYLATYPDGKLAVEARYDRALVLVKLARWAEARAALTPFATAPAGSYRQREAAALLAAIRNR